MKLLALTLSAFLLSGCLATESVPEKVLVLAVEDTTIATPLPEPEVLNEEEPDNEKANLEPTPPSEVALEVVSETITPEPMPAPTPMPTPTPSPEPVAPVGQCTVYDNFDTITGVGWQRVNDSVMGGRSLGGF